MTLLTTVFLVLKLKLKVVEAESQTLIQENIFNFSDYYYYYY
jgi:hypothetical protein